MLTLDLLADNHRRIYEAVRDAGKPVSPSEIEVVTEIEGSNLRSTLGTMVKKGLPLHAGSRLGVGDFTYKVQL